MSTFLQQVINGLTLGSMYALIALGYTMVYGIIELINFAHGEIFMIGAYLGVLALAMMISGGTLTVPLPVALALSFLVAIGGCALLGVLIERIAYRPLRRAPRLTLLITALGMSIFLQNAMMLIVGARETVVPQIFPTGGLTVGDVSITYLQMFILGVALTMMVGLDFLVRRTKLGKAMRATAQDHEVAGLMGIDPNRIIALTFIIGSGLGAVAGVLYGMYYNVISFFIGYQAGFKAFVAAVLGGIGSIPGAMLGGIVLGLIESLWAGYGSTQWKDAAAFTILVAVLLFRPAGLLGEKVPEKL